MKGNIIIKSGLSLILSRCGVFPFLERSRLRNKAVVLMYHRVLDPLVPWIKYVHPGMYVSRRSFDKQIAFLKRNFRVLFLEELLEKINKNQDIGGCCAITFDDGWLDNYTNAFPILTKYKVPATIFLASGFIGTKRLFWPDEMVRHLAQCPQVNDADTDLNAAVIKFHSDIKEYSAISRDCYLEKAIEILKRFPSDERNAVVEHYRNTGKPLDDTRHMLAWEEVEVMGKSGLVSFGSHTSGHEILDRLQLGMAREEVRQSREEIERQLGVKVRTFAYPNGNYNEDVLETVKECGFDYAVTTKNGLLDRDAPLLEIPRIAIHEDVSNTIPMFRWRIIFRKC